LSAASVESSLLEESEGALGKGSTARRVARLEASLAPMFASLPKNEYGNLNDATARYALHRLFVQRHGWYVNGLEPGGEHYNASSPTDVLKDHPLIALQGLFEKRLKQHGFNLHDTAVFAATLEHLIHKEAVELTEQAYEVNNFSKFEPLNQDEVDRVLDTHMRIYLAGDRAARFSDKTFAEIYPLWKDTQGFLRDTCKNVVDAEGDHQHKAGDKRVFTLEFVTRIMEEVFEHFGAFQDSDCKQMKNELLTYGDKDTGLVRLSSFYKAALDKGSASYNEPKDYLRELGALDESDPTKPRVIVPNYIT